MKRNHILWIALLGLLALLGILTACGDGGDEDDGDEAGNNPPFAVNDAYSITVGTSLAIMAPGVLSNDTDRDGDDLNAVLRTRPTGGTLTLNDDGGFAYTPTVTFQGTDSFTYWANDGSEDSIPATVTITVKVPPFSYDGKTDQSMITAVNAETLVRNALEFGPRLEIFDVVVGIIEDAGLLDGPIDIPYQRVVGNCGGYADLQFQFDERTGALSGQIQFVEYCNDWWEENLYLNGTVPFDGNYVTTTNGYTFSLRLSFNDLDALESTVGDVSLTFTEGEATLVLSLDQNDVTEDYTFNYVLRDNGLPIKTYWSDNLQLTFFIASGAATGDTRFKGRFYDHEHGFVDIETEGALIETGDITTGILWFNGKESKAKLTFTANESPVLQVDDDNDGEFEYADYIDPL